MSIFGTQGTFTAATTVCPRESEVKALCHKRMSNGWPHLQAEGS